jgi:hypothetical protein
MEQHADHGEKSKTAQFLPERGHSTPTPVPNALHKMTPLKTNTIIRIKFIFNVPAGNPFTSKLDLKKSYFAV